MQTVSIRELKSRLSYYLKHLPIKVTNWGNVVTIMYPPDVDYQKEIDLLKAYIKELENKKPLIATDNVTNVVTASDNWEEMGVCEKCKMMGVLTEMNVPVWDGTLGEEVGRLMKICSKCVKNLKMLHSR